GRRAPVECRRPSCRRHARRKTRDWAHGSDHIGQHEAVLRDDLQTARRAAKRHAAAADRAGFTAHEQALTEIVLTRAAPSASVYTYSQRDEGRVGADWLWWWRGTREWFGVLVQAKRNKPRA